MRAVRQVEIGLAGVIAGCALFASMVPDARSDEDHALERSYGPPALPGASLADFQDINVSAASRAVAASVLSGETRASRFAAEPPRATPRDSVAFSVRPTAETRQGPAWSGSALGVQVAAAPQSLDGQDGPNWWLVGGVGRESYAVAPGGLREFTVAPVGVESTVGDAHLGVSVKVGKRSLAGVGYVREDRKFVLGSQDWEEEDHYLGMSYRARW